MFSLYTRWRGPGGREERQKLSEKERKGDGGEVKEGKGKKRKEDGGVNSGEGEVKDRKEKKARRVWERQ